MTTGNADVDRALISLALTGLTGLIARWLRPRARVRYFNPHEFTFLVRPPNGDPFTLATKSLRVESSGREPARNVEVHFAFKPANVSVFPTFAYEEINNPEGNYIVRVPILAPGEGFWVHSMNTGTAPFQVQVRSDAGPGRAPKWQFQYVFPLWAQVLVNSLLVLGAAAAFYILLKLLAYLGTT